MRRIALPAELTIPHLLEWQDVQSVLRDAFSRIPPELAQGNYVVALDLAQRACDAAGRLLDRYGEALALLFRAETCRRLERWEDSLDAIRLALHWLELRVAPVAHYNEAVGVYLEGTIHFTLQSEAKVVETFAYAQDALAESERYWSFDQNLGRVEDCRNMTRWMSQILDIQAPLQAGDAVLVLPIYELINQSLIRTGAAAMQPFEVSLPVEVVAPHLPPEIVPLQLDTMSFAFAATKTEHVAVRLPGDGAFLPQGRQGDLLIVEVTGTADSGELILTSDKTFVRQPDGRVAFRAVSRGAARPGGHIGIPRMLIREEGNNE